MGNAPSPGSDPLAELISDGLHLRFRKGRRTLSRPHHGGWFTPPCLHLLDVCEGSFDVQHPRLGARRLWPGECLCIVPGTRYFVRVHGDVAPIRYAHVELSLFGSLDLCEVCDFPDLVTAPAGAAIGDAIETVADHAACRPDDLAGLAEQRLARDRLLALLVAQAQIGERGRRLLAGVGRLFPVLRHINEHLREPLDRQRLAAVAGLSPTRLSVAFKQAFGEAPMQFVRRCRLQQARTDLIIEGDSIATIAERYRFSDAFHFSKAFKQTFGEAPAHYRRRLAGDTTTL